MKTFHSLFLLIQLLIPGAPCVGGAFPQENPYAQLVAAFRTARCVEVKTVPLELVGDTLIVDAFRPYYSAEFQYPYSLLFAAQGFGTSTGRSPALALAPAPAAKAVNYLVTQNRGLTDAQELRIPVSKPGYYYLLINDVNRSMLAFVVGAGRCSTLVAELMTGCVVYE